MTLRQLRYFAVLGEELNYRRAAERLFITQPALSTAIKQLEHQFGVTLFTRNTREVALTELGRPGCRRVRDALRGVDAAVDDLVALAAHRRRIKLGYLIGTGADLLFRLVRHFEAAHPEITVGAKGIRLLRPDGRARRRHHRSGDHQAARRSARPQDAHSRRRGLGGLPPARPSPGRTAPSCRIAELLDDPIVVAPASAGPWRDYWMAMDARDGKPPTIAAVAATYEEETTTIARGLGISFTSEASARLYDRQGIAYVPIVDRPRNYTALAWNPATLSREAAALVTSRPRRVELRGGPGRSSAPATYY